MRYSSGAPPAESLAKAHVVEEIAQHEMPVLRDAHMRDRGLVAGEIAMRRGAERFGQAQIEVRRLGQQAAKLVEQKAKALILGLEIGGSEVLPVAIEEIQIILDVGFLHRIAFNCVRMLALGFADAGA